MTYSAPVVGLDRQPEQMRLDPEIAELLRVLNTGFPAVETMTGAQARAAVRARFRRPARPRPVGAVRDSVTPEGIPLRIYWPAMPSMATLPLVVFAHGGGFVFCDLDTHDDLCRLLTNDVGAVVVSVDYRLAPEARWPTAAEDVYAALCWAVAHAGALGGDAARLVVAGDSAGGNLAAVTAVLARDRGGPHIAGQVLLYPVIAADFTTESYRRFATGYYNTAAAMAWYWDQYVPGISDRTHPYVSPRGRRCSGDASTLLRRHPRIYDDAGAHRGRRGPTPGGRRYHLTAGPLSS